MKRIQFFGLILAALLLAALLTGLAPSACADPAPQGSSQGVILSADGKTVTSYNGPGGHVLIPEGVTSIEGGAFSSGSGLISLTIPGSVTNIGGAAFYDCRTLKSVTFQEGTANSPLSIGEQAFWKCSSLESVTFPDRPMNIGWVAFADCTSLKEVTIPNGSVSIGDTAFCLCTSLESVSMPNGAASIGDCVFDRCTGIRSITIPNEVGTVGITVFGHSYQIENLTIHGSLTVQHTFRGYDCDHASQLEHVTITGGAVAEGAFDNSVGHFPSLRSVTLLDGVTGIGEMAFFDCASLESITIPNSVTEIGASAFEKCTGLKSLYIPGSVNFVGAAVTNLSGVKDIYFAGTEERWNEIIPEYTDFYFSGITFHYLSKSVSVSADPAEGGTVTGGGILENGQSATVTAVPGAGYAFIGWTEDGQTVSTENPWTFTPEGDRALTANFVPKTYTLTLTAPEFDAVEEGYAQPAAKPLTITSTGNLDATIASVALSGDGAERFILNKTDGATIPAGTVDSATYTVRPKAALAIGTYTATVTATYNDGATAAAEVSFTVNLLRTYTLKLTAPKFDEVEEGYDPPAAKPLIITSTGNSDATITRATLNGTGAESFILNKTDGATIPAGTVDSATYTVRPKAGLKPGVYSAVVAVWYDNDTPASGVLRFTVNEKWYPITFAMDEYIEVMMVQTNSHSYSPDNAVALEGETVQFEPLCCDDRFEIGSVTVTAEDGSPVACERYSEYYEEYDFTDTGWRFIMPGTPVTVRVTLGFGTPDFTLPAFLTTVEEEAFEGIAASVVDIPESCVSIGAHAFRNCPNLTQIRIPDGCALGTDVFDSCEMVYVFGTAGSPAETYCNAHDNCVFVPLE